jgi:hypothetical protein
MPRIEQRVKTRGELAVIFAPLCIGEIFQ